MAVNVEIPDKEKQIEEHLNAVFSLMGVKQTESNKDTAHRVAKMWVREIFRNDLNSQHYEELKQNIKVFPNENGYSDELIIATVPFHAFCEHHLLPFSGKVQIGYLANKNIIGLSKIPRIIDFWCHTPQLQEKLCNDILNTLIDFIQPNFACVRVIAEHTCVACRGIERDCETDTLSIYSKDVDVNEDYLIKDFFRRVGGVNGFKA